MVAMLAEIVRDVKTVPLSKSHSGFGMTVKFTEWVSSVISAAFQLLRSVLNPKLSAALVIAW
jgi:hypothetical protein